MRKQRRLKKLSFLYFKSRNYWKSSFFSTLKFEDKEHRIRRRYLWEWEWSVGRELFVNCSRKCFGLVTALEEIRNAILSFCYFSIIRKSADIIWFHLPAEALPSGIHSLRLSAAKADLVPHWDAVVPRVNTENAKELRTLSTRKSRRTLKRTLFSEKLDQN